MSLLSRERTQIFMTSFYNINCISNCFSLSTALLASPWWRWAVLGFMKSGLSQMKFRRGFERDGHISCFVVLLCSEAWTLAGRQRRRVRQALQEGWGWRWPPPPKGSGSQGSIKGGSLRAELGPASICSPGKSLLPAPKLLLCFLSARGPLVFSLKAES